MPILVGDIILTSLMDQTSQLPSDQKFGWFFAAVLALSGVYFKWKLASAWGIPLFMLGLVFAILAGAAPKLLAPLNKLWFQLGIALGRLVNPIVLGVIFFLLITPVAVFMKLVGRDVLHIKKREISSYWVKREPSGPEPESFKNQF